MPNYSSPLYQLTKLLAYHENAAAAVRQSLALLSQHLGKRGRATNGHASASTMLQDALVLDTARRAAPGVSADGRRQRKFTAKQRAEFSRRMKAHWKKRKAEGKTTLAK